MPWREEAPKSLLSIVIPTIDREDLLRVCITSIRADLGPLMTQTEIIIVDSSAKPVPKSIIPGVGQIIYQKQRFTGAGRPMNAGCQVARGACVAILNDDIKIVGAPLTEALEILQGDPMVGQVAIPFWDGHSDKPRTSEIGRKNRLYANFGVTRRALGDLAGWWGAHTHYYGDPHLSMYVSSKGFRIATATKGHIVHLEAPSYFRGQKEMWPSDINSTDDHVLFIKNWGWYVD
jgi:hypothetical protein